MFLPENTTAFDADQLRQLDDYVTAEYPGLVSWATELNMAKSPMVRDLALIATWGLLQTSERHEKDFRPYAAAGHDLTVPVKHLGYKSPLDCAGRAAGLAVKASLYIRWYDLDVAAFATAPLDMFHVMSDPRSEPLERAVGSSPKQVGLTDFDAQSVNQRAMIAAEEAIRTSGPEALDQFLQGRPPVGP